MKLVLDIKADALEELEAAAVWYEDQRPGLGGEFAAEVERVLSAIAEQPLAFPRWERDATARRALLDRFTYAVFFDVEPRRVVILAIAHTSRRPGYWGQRPRGR